VPERAILDTSSGHLVRNRTPDREEATRLPAPLAHPTLARPLLHIPLLELDTTERTESPT